MRISDWSSDVCSSDLAERARGDDEVGALQAAVAQRRLGDQFRFAGEDLVAVALGRQLRELLVEFQIVSDDGGNRRSEEHTSELQSLMRISYAVFCLKKKTKQGKPTEQT